MEGGAVVSSWRCPGSPLMGEEPRASDVTDRGLLGDRSPALVDTETTRVGRATNPKKWSTMFEIRVD
jgi:MOSC domain-containing protein